MASHKATVGKHDCRRLLLSTLWVVHYYSHLFFYQLSLWNRAPLRSKKMWWCVALKWKTRETFFLHLPLSFWAIPSLWKHSCYNVKGWSLVLRSLSTAAAIVPSDRLTSSLRVLAQLKTLYLEVRAQVAWQLVLGGLFFFFKEFSKTGE